MAEVEKSKNAIYKANQYAKAKAEAERLGVVNRVLPVPRGIDQQLQDLAEWHDFTDWRELVLLLIRNCHALGPGPNKMVEFPRCGFVPTETQLVAVGEPCGKCHGVGFVLDADLETVECEKCK